MSVDPRIPRDDVDTLLDALRTLHDRVDELESPSGTQAYQSVRKLRALIDDIQAQLDRYNANRYTNAQIDNLIATHTQDQTRVTGTWDKPVNNGTGGVVRTGDLYAAQAPSFNMTSTRVAAWLQSSDGRLGTSSSSRRYKRDIVPFDVDPRLLLGVLGKWFRYIEQVQEHGDAAAVEMGFIAEELHDAGLGAFVVYRDHYGKPQPDGVNYVMWVVALQHLARWQEQQRIALEARVANVERRLGISITAGLG